MVYPPSNTEIRNETKRQKNELKYYWKVYADSLDAVIKLERQKTKQNNSDNKADTKQNKSNNKVGKAKVKQDGKTDRKWVGWINGLMLGLGLGIILTIFVSWWIGAYRRKDNKSEP